MPTKDLCQATGAPAHRHRRAPVAPPASLLAQSAARRMIGAIIAITVLWAGVIWALSGQ